MSTTKNVTPNCNYCEKKGLQCDHMCTFKGDVMCPIMVANGVTCSYCANRNLSSDHMYRKNGKIVCPIVLANGANGPTCNYCANRDLPCNHKCKENGTIVCPVLLKWKAKIPNTCNFCENSGLEFDHPMKDSEGNTVCPELLINECSNCFKRGHTTSHCPLNKPVYTRVCNYCQEEGHVAKHCPEREPVSKRVCNYCQDEGHNRQQCPILQADKRAAEQEERDTVQLKSVPNSYAGKLAASLPTTEDNVGYIRTCEQPLDVWSVQYPIKMMGRYGVFWPFLVTGTKLDHDIANNARSVFLSERFYAFLQIQYGGNWLHDTVGSIHDCEYLADLRHADKVAKEADMEFIANAETSRIAKLKARLDIKAFQLLMDEECFAHMEAFDKAEADKDERAPLAPPSSPTQSSAFTIVTCGKSKKA